MDPELFAAPSGHDPRGDRLADLIRTHDRELRRVAAAITLDRDRAGAAVSATWMAARRRMRAPRRAPRQWLLARVARESHRRVRPAWVNRVREHLGSRLQPPPVGNRAADPALADLVAELTPEDRLMLALHHAAGLTSDEIAVQLELTGAGVRAHLAELLERLVAALDVDRALKDGTPLTPREIEARVAGRLLAWLDGVSPAPFYGQAPGGSATPAVDRRGAGSRWRRLALPTLTLPVTTRRRGLTIGLALVVVTVLVASVSIRLANPDAGVPATPTPTPGTLLAFDGWTERTTQVSRGVQVLAWAPDGRHLAVQTGTGEIAIYDAAGSVVRSFTGSEAVWLDADRLLVMQPDPTGGRYAAPGTNLSIRGVDAADDQLLPTPAPAERLVGGGGLAIGLSASLEVRTKRALPVGFEVLGPDGLSEPHAGVPVAWTPDGSQLAYLDGPTIYQTHYVGSLHLLNATTGEDRDTGQYVEEVDASAFDPTGRWLIVGTTAIVNGVGGSALTILDTVEGRLEPTTLSADTAHLAWTGDGSVAVATRTSVLRWRPGDTPVALPWVPEEPNNVESVVAVREGIAIGLSNGPADPRLVAGTSPTILALPGHTLPGAAVSRDGTRLAYARIDPASGTVLVLATIPPLGPSTASSSAPSASLAPSKGPPSLPGIPILALPNQRRATLTDASPIALWGTHVYAISAYQDPETVLSVLDMTDGQRRESHLLADAMQPGDTIVALRTDGTWLLVEVSRHTGPPGDGGAPCSSEQRQPIAWRLLRAPLGPDGVPFSPFAVIASGTASRITTPSGDGISCAYTSPPPFDLRDGLVAYATEAATTAHPWASRITVRRLDGGTRIASLSAGAPVPWIELGDGMLAWLVEPDAGQPSAGTWSLQLSTPVGAAAQTVEVPTGPSPYAPTFLLIGQELYYTVFDLSTGPSVWHLDRSTGIATSIKVPGAGETCGATGGAPGVVFLQCWSQAASEILVWRAADGVAVLGQSDPGGPPTWVLSGGGWGVLVARQDSGGADLVAFPLTDLTP